MGVGNNVENAAVVLIAELASLIVHHPPKTQDVKQLDTYSFSE